ncbi:MAG: hypothetical protein ABI678_03660 [Kofleriaceae bacterium]
MKSFLITCAVLVGLGTAAEASSWQINAASCVQDAATIQNGLAAVSSGRVSFAAGKSGDLVLYCPMPFNLWFSPTGMWFVYTTNASTSSDFIEMQYIKMNMTSPPNLGNIGTDALLFNTSTPSTPNWSFHQAITTSYIPNNYAYWIRVDLVRSTPTSSNPVLFAVRVDG